MSTAAISIYAEIELRRSKFLAELNSMKGELKNLNSAGSKIELPVAVKLAPDTQARLDAAVAKLTPPTVDVKVNFIPGTMPSPGGSMAGSSPSGAGGGTLRGMDRLQEATGGAGGGAGGGGRSFMRGFGRYLGPGILLHEAFRAVETFQKYQGEMERAQMTNDLRGQMKAEEDLQSGVKSLPIVGQAAGLIADQIGGKRGIDRTMTEADMGDRKAKGMGELGTSMTGIHEKTAAIGKSETERRAMALAQGGKAVEAAIGKAIEGIPADQRPNKAIAAVRTAWQGYVAATEHQQTIERDNSLHGLSNERDVLRESNAGNTDQASRIALAAKQESREIELRKKDAGEANKYRDEVAPRERQQLEDDIRRQREKAEGDTAAKISEMQVQADARVLHAKGEVYAATETLLKHSVDSRVAALNREAAAEKDVIKSAQLHREAIAAGAAGAKDLEALRTADTRHGEQEARSAANERGTAELDAGGHHREASRKALDDQYKEDADKVIREGGPGQQDRLRALDDRYAARKAGLDHHDELTSEQRQLRAYRANAEFAGDNASGAIMELRNRARHEYDDANGNVQAQHDVTSENLAELRRLRRTLSPTVRRGADGEQFSHDLGNAIGEGPFNADARKLFDKTDRELKAGGVSNDLPEAGVKMQRAAEKLEKAADRFGNSKVAVLDTH